MSRKTGVILSYVMMIFEVLSTLLLTPFIIKSLGQAEFGVYKLTSSITAYLLLLDLGVGNAVTRYISKYHVSNERNKEREFLGVATIYYVIIALLALVCGMVMIEAFPNAFAKGLSLNEIALGQKLLSLTMINIAVTLVTAAFNNVLIAYEYFAVSKSISIIQIIVRMGLTFSAVNAGFGSMGIVIINLLMTIVSRAITVAIVLFKIKLLPKFSNIEWDFVKDIISYSSLILLQMIATMINSNIDQILIGSIVAKSSMILAVYSIGTQIVQYYQSIGSAFSGVLMPGIVRLVERSPEKTGEEMLRISRLTLIVLGIIWGGFIVCGKTFVILWAGVDNIDAYYVTVILMTAYMLILSESVGTQILWALDKHKKQAYLKLAIVITNIFLTIILIRWNPLIGATIGTFISLLLGDVFVMNYIFVKELKLNLIIFYKELLRGIAPSLVLSITIGYLIQLSIPHNSWGWLLITSTIIVVSYSISMLLIGFNDYEKELIRSIFSRIHICLRR